MEINLPHNPTTITLSCYHPPIITKASGIMAAYHNGQIDLACARYILGQLRRFDTLERETDFERELAKTIVNEIIKELENK